MGQVVNPINPPGASDSLRRWSCLKKRGLVTVVDTLNPGHGINKVVQPVAEIIEIKPV